MLIIEIYKFYGSWSEIARKLGFGMTTYQGWIRRGYIPMKTQELIEVRSKGRFRASLKHTIAQPEVEGLRKKTLKPI